MDHRVWVDYGVLGLIVFVSGLAIYKITKWGAEYVLQPVVAAHLNYMQHSIEALEETRQVTQLMRELDVNLQASAERVKDATEGIHDRIDKQGRAIVLLSHAVRKVADAHEININDLVDEIRREVASNSQDTT